MAALTRFSGISVRAAWPGEGHAIADLWRELWDAHEAWGGYAGTTDARVYERLAVRLSEDARMRAGQPILGRHIHLVAETDEGIVGQVEGWFDRYGFDEKTPFTCEVRSLIVSSRARARGIGRVLLDQLAHVSKTMSRGTPVLMAAEVLEPNPAKAFYDRVGFVPVSWSTRVRTDVPSSSLKTYTARLAAPSDALSMSVLDAVLAERRRAQGDMRFDKPRAVDATLVGALASQIARQGTSRDPREPFDIVVLDAHGMVRGSAALSVTPLDPPFLPARRGVLGRLSIDPALDPAPLAVTLLRFGQSLARDRGAATMEITDLDAPGGALYQATLAAAAAPWSRIVERLA